MSGDLAGTLEDSCLSDVLNSSRGGSASVSRAVIRSQKKGAHFLWGWKTKGRAWNTHNKHSEKRNYTKEQSVSVWKYWFFFLRWTSSPIWRSNLPNYNIWKLLWSAIITKPLMCADTGACSDASAFVSCFSSDCLIIGALYLLKDLLRSKEIKSLEESLRDIRCARVNF